MYDLFHNTTKGRLCFLDGVIDFNSQKFYTWDEIDFEYYSCVQIKRNIKPLFDNYDKYIPIVDIIKNNIILPLFGDKTELALHFFSRAMAGYNLDKNNATYLGNRDCGKGVIFNAFKNAFEDYVDSFTLDNVLCGRETSITPQEAEKKLYWLMDLEFVRLAISQETPSAEKKLKVNSELWKKMNGGNDEIRARRNFDRTNTLFKIDTTFFCAGNDYLQMDGDLSEHRIEFESFTQFKTKEYIDSEIEKNNQKDEDNQLPKSYFKRFRFADPTIYAKTETDDYKNAIIF
jgi:hypothetical protein